MGEAVSRENCPTWQRMGVGLCSLFFPEGVCVCTCWGKVAGKQPLQREGASLVQVDEDPMEVATLEREKAGPGEGGASQAEISRAHTNCPLI